MANGPLDKSASDAFEDKQLELMWFCTALFFVIIISSPWIIWVLIQAFRESARVEIREREIKKEARRAKMNDKVQLEYESWLKRQALRAKE